MKQETYIKRDIQRENIKGKKTYIKRRLIWKSYIHGIESNQERKHKYDENK